MNATNTNQVESLRDLRKARGLTQVEVALLVGCSVNYIGMLEAGYVPRRGRVRSDVIRVLTSPLDER